jgi:hypothetical protein
VLWAHSYKELTLKKRRRGNKNKSRVSVKCQKKKIEPISLSLAFTEAFTFNSN